ncbi:unnamed protein product [Nezara viridula]|uniref:Uncharacterized protein n=1 Tax=Nezara viridula TaxID=85310 RepID=A0A9P0MPN7_NEZVI|nr:unnamed protein product [Nezara viridula]
MEMPKWIAFHDSRSSATLRHFLPKNSDLRRKVNQGPIGSSNQSTPVYTPHAGPGSVAKTSLSGISEDDGEPEADLPKAASSAKFTRDLLQHLAAIASPAWREHPLSVGL